MLCRTENRVRQLAQPEPGKQTTEARALDAKLDRRPSDQWIARRVVWHLGERRKMRDRLLSHAKPFCKVWHYPAALPDRHSIMTPRIHGLRPGSTPVEIWISKPVSYTMLPSHARARSHSAARWSAVARGPQGGCALPPASGVIDVACQHPNCGVTPAIGGSTTQVETAKYMEHMILLIYWRPARLLLSKLKPTTPPSPHPGRPHGESR